MPRIMSESLLEHPPPTKCVSIEKKTKTRVSMRVMTT